MFKSKLMFIISFKKIKKVFFIFICVSICILTVLFIGSKKQNITLKNNIVSVFANDNNSRLLFFKERGWNVGTEPLEVCSITIPCEFNNTFSAYNELQKAQGFDLSKYRGKTCQKYTYQILNYTDGSQNVRATVIVFKNKVIGGDIFKAGPDGFIRPIASS